MRCFHVSTQDTEDNDDEDGENEDKDDQDDRDDKEDKDNKGAHEGGDISVKTKTAVDDNEDDGKHCVTEGDGRRVAEATRPRAGGRGVARGGAPLRRA